MAGAKRGRKSYKKVSKKFKTVRRTNVRPDQFMPQAPAQPTAPPPIATGGDGGVAPDQQPNS